MGTRIISVEEVKHGGDGRRKNKRYGWNVIRYAGPPVAHTAEVIRILSKVTGKPLKHPVTETVTTYEAGIESIIRRRRSSVRKLLKG